MSESSYSFTTAFNSKYSFKKLPFLVLHFSMAVFILRGATTNTVSKCEEGLIPML